VGRFVLKGIITSKSTGTLKKELRRYRPLVIDIGAHPPYTGRLTAKILARIPGEEIDSVAEWLDGSVGSVISALAPGAVQMPPGKYPTPEMAASILGKFIPKLTRLGIDSLIIGGFSPLSGSHLLRTLRVLQQAETETDFHIFTVLPTIPQLCKPEDMSTDTVLSVDESTPILAAMLSLLPKTVAGTVAEMMGFRADSMPRIEAHQAFLRVKRSWIPDDLIKSFKEAVLDTVSRLPKPIAAHTLRVAADIFFYHNHRIYRKMKTTAMVMFRNMSELVLAIHSGLEALVGTAKGDRISTEVVRLMNLQRYHPRDLLMFLQSALKMPNAPYLFNRYWMNSATYDVVSAKPYKDNLDQYGEKRLGWHWKIYRDIAHLDYETETGARDMVLTHSLTTKLSKLTDKPFIPSDIVAFGLIATSLSYLRAEHYDQSKKVLYKLIEYLKRRDLLSLLGVAYHNMTQLLSVEQIPAYIYLPYSKAGTRYQILSGGSTRFAPHFFAHYIQDAAGTTIWPKLKDFMKAVDNIHMPIMSDADRAYILSAEAFAFSIHAETLPAKKRLWRALSILPEKDFHSMLMVWAASAAVNTGDKRAAEEIMKRLKDKPIRDENDKVIADIASDLLSTMLAPGTLNPSIIEHRDYPDEYKETVRFFEALHSKDIKTLEKICVRLSADLIQQGNLGEAGWFNLLAARAVKDSEPELAKQVATKAAALFHTIGAEDTTKAILQEFGIGLLSQAVLSSLAEELILHGLKNSMIEMLLKVERPIEENLLDILMNTLAAVKGTLIIKTGDGKIHVLSKSVLGDVTDALTGGDIEIEGGDKDMKVIFRGVMGDPDNTGIPAVRRMVITRLMATIPRILKAGAEQRKQIYDQLTGTYNRWFALRKLDEILERNGLVTVVFIDIDRFKELNDSIGHIAGDKILSRIGRILMDVVGDRGIVGRFGGDEFLIILPDADTNMAYMIAREIIKRIEGLNVGISASAGIVSTENGAFKNKEEMLHLADQTMYLAKEKKQKILVAYR